MPGHTLPGIKDLDLPTAISRFAQPTPPLTPTQSFDSSHGGWPRRISSFDESYSEALTKLSASVLGYLGPVTNHGSRKPSTFNIGELMTVSSSPLLPSIKEFMRGVCEMAIEAQFQRNHGNSPLPTPLPSPVCSSSVLYGAPDPKHRVPWSRAPFPTGNLAAEFFHQRVLKGHELRKRESREPAIRNIQKDARLPTAKRHDRSDARVKKPKTAAKRSKPKLSRDNDEDEIREKRSNKEYTPTQECFIIYHKAEKKLTWKQLEDAYDEFNVNQPHRSESALSCCYYRTNYHIPLTTPDGLLVLRWDYSEETEGRIREEMAKEQERLDKEYEKLLEEIKREEAKQEETEENNESDENEEKRDTKNKNKKKTRIPKKPVVPYPFSVHGDDGIPAVEYKNTQVWVRQSGDVSLFQRFPEVLANKRNTWVLPEDMERAKEIGMFNLSNPCCSSKLT